MTKLTPRTIRANTYSLSSDGISQSLLGMWNHCKRAFVMRVEGYDGHSKDENFNYGSIVHEVLDKAHTSRKLPSEKQVVKFIDEAVEKQWSAGVKIALKTMEADAALAQAVLIPYFEHFKSDFTKKKFYDVEQTFETKYNGATLRGKIDGKFTVNKKKWLMEHKTKGQINEDNILNYLPLDLQNRMYLLVDWMETGKLARGVLYNVIRKPGNKQLKNESLKDFMKKITGLVRKDPSHYFYRWENPYTQEEIEQFKQELDWMLEDIKVRSKENPYPSTGSCLRPFPCQYLKACSSNSLESLTSNKPLFPELEEENDEKKITGKKSLKRKKPLRRKK